MTTGSGCTRGCGDLGTRHACLVSGVTAHVYRVTTHVSVCYTSFHFPTHLPVFHLYNLGLCTREHGGLGKGSTASHWHEAVCTWCALKKTQRKGVKAGTKREKAMLCCCVDTRWVTPWMQTWAKRQSERSLVCREYLLVLTTVCRTSWRKIHDAFI